MTRAGREGESAAPPFFYQDISRRFNGRKWGEKEKFPENLFMRRNCTCQSPFYLRMASAETGRFLCLIDRKILYFLKTRFNERFWSYRLFRSLFAQHALSWIVIIIQVYSSAETICYTLLPGWTLIR